MKKGPVGTQASFGSVAAVPACASSAGSTEVRSPSTTRATTCAGVRRLVERPDNAYAVPSTTTRLSQADDRTHAPAPELNRGRARATEIGRQERAVRAREATCMSPPASSTAESGAAPSALRRRSCRARRRHRQRRVRSGRSRSCCSSHGRTSSHCWSSRPQSSVAVRPDLLIDERAGTCSRALAPRERRGIADEVRRRRRELSTQGSRTSADPPDPRRLAALRRAGRWSACAPAVGRGGQVTGGAPRSRRCAPRRSTAAYAAATIAVAAPRPLLVGHLGMWQYEEAAVPHGPQGERRDVVDVQQGTGRHAWPSAVTGPPSSPNALGPGARQICTWSRARPATASHSATPKRRHAC